MTPTVSVVLNCYNHEQYVGEAIESVLAQTFRDFELILIDNGSTDGSRRVMQSFDDDRIRLILHDENQSISRRLNEGVAAANGEFVSILYSDDLFLPHKLERQLAIFSELPDEYGVVYAPPIRFNQLTGARWKYVELRSQRSHVSADARPLPRRLDRHVLPAWPARVLPSLPFLRRPVRRRRNDFLPDRHALEVPVRSRALGRDPRA